MIFAGRMRCRAAPPMQTGLGAVVMLPTQMADGAGNGSTENCGALLAWLTESCRGQAVISVVSWELTDRRQPCRSSLRRCTIPCAAR